MSKSISGFSKLSKNQKIEWIIKTYFENSDVAENIIKQYWNSNERLQQLHDEFIENTITNFYLPFGIAPNFLIDGELFVIPMAIEESSVIAAASKAAKFWLKRGGFKAEVIATVKTGQVHFTFDGDVEKLNSKFESIKGNLISEARSITQNMEARGGGIVAIDLIDKSDSIPNYFQLHASFKTKDAMGANFINSCLEQFAKTFKREVDPSLGTVEIIMSILSNYVPDCLVRAEVSCPIQELKVGESLSPQLFAEKFIRAIEIAEIEPYRAVTHNKGIMNGIDAVVLATGNDFRAIEAGAHAYAARNGRYSSLTHATVEDGIFKFWIEIPLALGTVGGLTRLHPLAKIALQMLGNPTAVELMKITAVAGLAQNFAAISSLITTGIQQGHMKMHLMNILNELEASDSEKKAMVSHFKTNVVTHNSVVEALENIRS
ncbi:MAG: hydroxymethylglutaryl-CoA reductase, degradative [Flavobacteriaceae bacterium]|nr:MAG: hydroxymethylglutaryl-CoA reductase, degradative [Flavobacteriaceae bacterium]